MLYTFSNIAFFIVYFYYPGRGRDSPCHYVAAPLQCVLSEQHHKKIENIQFSWTKLEVY